MRDIQVVTTNHLDTQLVTWTNTGFLDSATTGFYAFTDITGPPAGSTGGFDGVMIDLELSKIYVSRPQQAILRVRSAILSFEVLRGERKSDRCRSVAGRTGVRSLLWFGMTGHAGLSKREISEYDAAPFPPRMVLTWT